MARVDINARLRPFVGENDLGKKASFFTSLRTFEDGFDRAQGLIRTIASAWLLVALAALGTVVANDAACLVNPSTTPPPEGCNYPFGSLARSLILLAAALGITSLWYLDQRVYMSLLHSIFALGVKLEELDHQLPPVRTVLRELNQDITSALSWFYRAPLWAFLCLQLLNGLLFHFVLYDQVAQRFRPPAARMEWWLLFGSTLAAVLAQLGIFLWARSWPSLGPHGRDINTLTFPAVPDPDSGGP